MAAQRENNRRTARLSALVLIAISLLVALTMFAAPEASAHSGKFEHNDIVFGDTCPVTHISNGLQNDRFIGCTPLGYTPIGTDVALCEETRGFFVEDWCTYDRARPCSSQLGGVGFSQPISDGMCIRPALVLEEFKPIAVVRSVTPVCVETTLVQEQAAGQQVGAQFNQGGISYLITTGGQCSFNCVQGWDMNCDGKLGDFCASEYDLTKVADVGSCMADNDVAPTNN